jgi:dimethylsulfoniopropionate demethylase
MILKDYWEIGNEVFVNTFNGKNRKGIITSLPFPD